MSSSDALRTLLESNISTFTKVADYMKKKTVSTNDKERVIQKVLEQKDKNMQLRDEVDTKAELEVLEEENVSSLGRTKYDDPSIQRIKEQLWLHQNEKLEKQNEKIAEQDAKIERLAMGNKEKDGKIKTLKIQVGNLSENVKVKDQEIQTLKRQVRSLSENEKVKDQEIQTLKTQVRSLSENEKVKDEEIQTLKTQVHLIILLIILFLFLFVFIQVKST